MSTIVIDKPTDVLSLPREQMLALYGILMASEQNCHALVYHIDFDMAAAMQLARDIEGQSSDVGRAVELCVLTFIELDADADPSDGASGVLAVLEGEFA